MANVIVAPGDCLSSIAARHGFTWPVLWNAPENAGLKAKRKDPNILHPGDVVWTPETQLKHDSAVTGRRHVYEVDIEPTFVKLRFLYMGLPRSGLRWVLTLSDRELASGVTDGEGHVEAKIDARSGDARLRLFPPDAPVEDYAVKLGHLDPLDTVTGVQQRLANLGLDPGPIDGVPGPRTEAAVRAFQVLHELAADGVPGPPTQQKLKQAHGG